MILKVEILFYRESNQANAKMMEKIVSTSSKETWGSGGLRPEKFPKATLTWLENALLRSRKTCLCHKSSSWSVKYDPTLQSVLCKFEETQNSDI